MGWHGGRHTLRLVFLFEGGLLVLAVGLGWLFGHAPLGNLRLDAGDAFWAVLATVPPLVLMLWSDRSRLSALRELKSEVERLVGLLFSNCTTADFALVSLLAGLGEEALFRGLIQPLVAAQGGTAAGLVTASVLFGLAHFVTPGYALAATVIGFYLGWLALAFDNLLVPVVVHALYDFVTLVYLRRTLGRKTPP